MLSSSCLFFFLMIRRPPRSTLDRSSAASDVYKRQVPTEETIADGTYGFSRSLYIYVSTTALAENPAVGEYVDVYLSEAGLAMVGDAGYVSLPADRQEAAAAAWAGAKG